MRLDPFFSDAVTQNGGKGEKRHYGDIGEKRSVTHGRPLHKTEEERDDKALFAQKYAAYGLKERKRGGGKIQCIPNEERRERKRASSSSICGRGGKGEEKEEEGGKAGCRPPSTQQWRATQSRQTDYTGFSSSLLFPCQFPAAGGPLMQSGAKGGFEE